MGENVLIQFRNVFKTFYTKSRKIQALHNINLTIEKGDIFGVIGHSGAGKSTLIRTVNLLEQPTKGEIIVNGKNLVHLSEREMRDVKKNIGMIFQHFNLLESKNIFDNVALPLRLIKASKVFIAERVKELLTFVGLEDKIHHYPNQLSGGQKQRVGIARALATNPSILLCDEATSALDPETTLSVLQLLKQINRQYGITILMITHQMDVVKQICNRVGVMHNGELIEEGRIIDVFSNPQNPITENFVKTVIKDDVPEKVFDYLKSKNDSRVYRIRFVGESTGQPLISEIAKAFTIHINILFGNITELQNVPFGHLIVEFQGDVNEIQRAYEHISAQNIVIKEVG